jgi:hypothetical protein
MRMFLSIVCGIAAVLFIKMMDLPGLITVPLVIIVVGFVIYSLSGAFAKVKTDAGK